MHSPLFTYLNSFIGQSIIIDGLVVVFARYFQYIVIGYALILMYRTLVNRDPDLNPRLYIHKAISEAVWIFGSVASAFIVTAILKVSFAIPRPFLSGIEPLFIHGGYNSFPSGHATIFAALTVAMFLFHKKRGWWFFFSALAIGGARVMAGVHYPIDILAGYIIGALFAYITYVYIRPRLTKYLHMFEY